MLQSLQQAPCSIIGPFTSFALVGTSPFHSEYLEEAPCPFPGLTPVPSKSLWALGNCILKQAECPGREGWAEMKNLEVFFHSLGKETHSSLSSQLSFSYLSLSRGILFQWIVNERLYLITRQLFPHQQGQQPLASHSGHVPDTPPPYPLRSQSPRLLDAVRLCACPDETCLTSSRRGLEKTNNPLGFYSRWGLRSPAT